MMQNSAAKCGDLRSGRRTPDWLGVLDYGASCSEDRREPFEKNNSSSPCWHRRKPAESAGLIRDDVFAKHRPLEDGRRVRVTVQKPAPALGKGSSIASDVALRQGC